MSKPLKAVVELSVIPQGWTLDHLIEVANETGFIVVDTQYYSEDGLGVQIIDDDNLEILKIEEYNERKRMEERSVSDTSEEE